MKVVDLTEVDDDLKEELLTEVTFLKLFEGSEHVIQLLASNHLFEDGNCC